MSKRAYRGSPLAFRIDVARSAATAVTLSVRVPQLATGRMSAAERRRTVFEKHTAAGEGALQGVAATTRAAMRRAAKHNPFMPMAALNDILAAHDGPTGGVGRRRSASRRR